MNRREFKKRRVKLYQTPEIVQHFLALQFKDFGIDFTAVNSLANVIMMNWHGSGA